MTSPGERFGARLFTSTLSISLGAAALTGLAPASHAVAVTCQGLPATIVGPTSGENTTGTEGDDVIVAPISANSRVSALGGNDKVCLVDAPASYSIDPMVAVSAGNGDDSVTNETTRSPGAFPRVELGSGADTYVGADYGEGVAGSAFDDTLTPDTEVDEISARGGDDSIQSGSPVPASPNHDAISTGGGRDIVTYAGVGGGAIDNGEGNDTLTFRGPWVGELQVDNVTRQAKLGADTLTWTNVDTFLARVTPGSGLAFTGSDAAETLSVSGTARDITAASTISMGGGADAARLRYYFPASVDLGGGYDVLSYIGCGEAIVALPDEAECTTSDGRDAVTDLDGVEYFWGKAVSHLTVIGTPSAERIVATAQHVLVRVGKGNDRVTASGSQVKVSGGRGSDRIKASAPRGVTIEGGRGHDIIRGDKGPDQLYGGRGQDSAYGQKGRDRCMAELRVNCERR